MRPVFLRLLLPVLSAASLGLLTGCSATKENAVFVTKTSFSLFDIDATPGGISVAYDRIEGYAGPRFGDGNVFPVASYIATNGKGFSRDINQVYATGDAARIVTLQPGQQMTVREKPQTVAEDGKVMFFATGTAVGLKLGFAQGALTPTSLSLGYKRKELSIIPVDKDRQPAVLATFKSATGVEAPAPQAGGRAGALFDVQQFFATGDAAIQLAANSGIKGKFREAANAGMSKLEAYHAEEAKQGRIALDALDCLFSLSDSKLDRAWNNAEDLRVFLIPGAVVRIRQQPPAKQRERYITEMAALVGAGSEEQTQRLRMHQEVVCKL